MSSANTTSILKDPDWRGAGLLPAVRNWSGSAAAVMVRLKALAPYALIELVLPGGSLMALLLWLYRRRKNGSGFGPLSVKWLSFSRWMAARGTGGSAILRAVPNCRVLGCEMAHSSQGKRIRD
jgi:hypothetical protein